MNKDKISVKGAREHNLKNVDLEIPKGKLVVFTGLSGSGKSSLAFDTIYAEGQRRYVESLSSYARQFLGIMKKPDVDVIEGLSPAISIDQKSTSRNPRSTVGTVTEIYDYMRLLWARIGHPHCPNCAREIQRQTPDQIVDQIFSMLSADSAGPSTARIKLLVLGPIVKDRKGEYRELFSDLKKRGFKYVRIDGKVYPLSQDLFLIKTNKHTIEVVTDRIVLTKDTERRRVFEAVEAALRFGSGEAKVSKILDKGFTIPDAPQKMQDSLFSEKFACPVCGISIPEVEPRIFSFNTPHGACPACNGLGYTLSVDKDLVLNKNLSINEGGIMVFSNISYQDTWFARTFKKFCQDNGISLSQRLSDIDDRKLSLLMEGTADKEYEVEGENRWGKKTVIYEPFRGLVWEILNKYKNTESSFIKAQMEKFMRDKTCTQCQGSRLRKEAMSVTVKGRSIIEASNMSIGQCRDFIKELPKEISKKEEEIARLIIKEIVQRLEFLLNVGLDYLTLGRSAETLSGGEAQRIRLASQIGSGLTGVLYVLDEPSIGLHQRDNGKLIDTLMRLRDIGNTVIVVEHDKEMMTSADYIVDFGPEAGEKGGEVVAQGTPAQIIKDPKSLTGKYLSGSRKINVPRSDKNETSILNTLKILGAKEHNLKNINVEIPLNKLTVITGVSGSGKSTLIYDILYHALMQKQNAYHKELPGRFDKLEGYEKIKRVFMIDQSPIGRTPRSNPATYTGAFSYIRDVFASTKEARARGWGPGRFSFNVKGGRCEACQGEGQIKIEMQFLSDVYVTCEVCSGLQYQREILEVLFNGKNISDVLRMSVLEAMNFFSFIPSLYHKLSVLNDVGLSYIKLGQPAPTLSGGEAQRVKLAAELSKRSSNAMYLLDEPTTGLHFADLEKLLFVLRKLVELGNSVVVIEHNLDVIKNADYIIDLGPEGGDKGGYIVATGTPDEIKKKENSYTGFYLRKE